MIFVCLSIGIARQYELHKNDEKLKLKQKAVKNNEKAFDVNAVSVVDEKMHKMLTVGVVAMNVRGEVSTRYGFTLLSLLYSLCYFWLVYRTLSTLLTLLPLLTSTVLITISYYS